MEKYQEFEGLSHGYNKYRASYPDSLIYSFVDAISPLALKENTKNRVLDVGSGTGISTRVLRNILTDTISLVGVEPGKDMLDTSRKESEGIKGILYVEGKAEELPFSNNSITSIFVAQAIQWFDRPRFYREAIRVLRKHGSLGIIQNNRDWRNSSFLKDYEAILEEYSPKYSRTYRDIDIEKELKAFPQFGTCVVKRTSWDMVMKPEDFISWAMTSSKVKSACKNIGKEAFQLVLENLKEKHFPNNKNVVINYVAELFLVQIV